MNWTSAQIWEVESHFSVISVSLVMSFNFAESPFLLLGTGVKVNMWKNGHYL